MTVAVLGATGFLGSSIVSHLRQQGHTVHAWGRSLVRPDEQNFRWQADNENAMDERWLQYDAVLYAAGAGVQSQLSTDFEQLMSVNFLYPAHLMHFLSAGSFRGFYISFGSYFEIGDNDDPQTFTEEEVAHSRHLVPNLYCSTKRLLTRWVSSTTWSMGYTHLILPTIYGEGEASHRLIPYLVNCATAGTPPRLTAGTQVRQYVHVQDVCRAVEALLSRPLRVPLLNMAATEVWSVQALARHVYGAIGVELPLEAFGQVTARDTSMGYLALDSTRYQNLNLPRPVMKIQQYIQQLLSHHV